MTSPRPVLCLLFSWALLITLSATASPENSWMQTGDSAYAHKMYDSALSSYRAALRQDSSSALLQFKLANTHYRLNQTGEAVFAYEKALHLQPGFGPAAENLRLIQKNLSPSAESSDVFFLRWWKSLTRASLSNTWALLALSCFLLPLILLAWGRWNRVLIAWLWPHWTISGVLLSVAFAVLAWSSLGKPELGTGVVMRAGAPFNTGSKAGMINLPEGLVVRVLREDKAGLLVSLEDGRQGTIQPSDIGIVK
jgi:hypothetical protein